MLCHSQGLRKVCAKANFEQQHDYVSTVWLQSEYNMTFTYSIVSIEELILTVHHTLSDHTETKESILGQTSKPFVKLANDQTTEIMENTQFF